MRTVLKFMCEKCRAVYDTPREVLRCEAGHYHLTLEIKQKTNGGTYYVQKESVCLRKQLW